MGYKHLTREQRYTIDALLQTPMSLREIGEVIGVSAGTVSREIRRNCDRRGYHRYRWQLAQKKYERRMKTRRHYLKFTDEMKRTVRRFIVYGQYSPEQICGRFRLKGEEMVCAETIYRCTHLVLIRRLAGKEATPLASTAIEALLPYKDKIHTITADNGKEFARHKEIAKGLDAEFYFARPYHSWERGANENTNGLIRQYIPKGTDFSELTDEMLAEIEWKLNHRPRKSLGYRTPLEYCKQLFNFDF